MTTKSMKSALTASLKAEERKVMGEETPASAQPAPKPKATKAKPTGTKPPAAAKASVPRAKKPPQAATAGPSAPPATSPTPPPAAQADKPIKAGKPAKISAKRVVAEKVTRDSFTMPDKDYRLIAELKRRAQGIGVEAKKSELLRAGLRALSELNPELLKGRLEGLEKVKTGRPAKGKGGKK